MHAKKLSEKVLTDQEPDVPVVAVRGEDDARVEVLGVGAGATTTDRGPVDAVVACGAQVVAWSDVAAPDKHQRRLHNSIRIS